MPDPKVELRCDSLENVNFSKKYSIDTLRLEAINLTDDSLLQHMRISNLNLKNCNQISPLWLHSAQDSISITSTQHNSVSVDLAQLSSSLGWIDASQVTLTNLTFIRTFPNLTTLHLTKLNIPLEVSMVIASKQIEKIEITHSNLRDLNISFEDCDWDRHTGDSVKIDLRYNQIKEFRFSQLFREEQSNCHYSVDLSHNTQLKPEILNSQLDDLRKYSSFLERISFTGVHTTECSCELIELYHTEFSSKLVNVFCRNLQDYLRNLSLCDQISRK